MTIAQRTPAVLGKRVRTNLNMKWMTDQVESSYQCNGSILSYLRNKAGLTQEALAKRSGYSRRLISKAEASQTISSATIQDLAMALSSQGHPVYPEDLIADPLAMTREFVLGMYRHGPDIVRICRRFLAANVVFNISGDPSVLPFAGFHRGREAAEDALLRFFSVFEPPPHHDPEPHYRFVHHGNNVIVGGKTWMQPHGQRLERAIALSIWMAYERGKIVTCDYLLDTGEASRVLLESKKLSPDRG